MTNILKITLALTLTIEFSACNSETTPEKQEISLQILAKKVS